MTDLDLLPWVRRGGPAGPAGEGGRPTSGVDFDLHDGAGSEAATLRFATPGPRDVRGLLPGAIRSTVPPAGDQDAEEIHCPYVELAEEDLPWRYGPTRLGRPQPWCVLVVGPPAQVQVQGERALLSGPVLGVHDLALADRWAHVQRPRGGAEGSGVARVLSPAPLDPTADYTAALVVPWDDAGEPAWSPGTASADVRCLHSWSFRTGLAGSFETLAAELHPADEEPVGTVEVVLPGGAVVEVPGALTTLDFSLAAPAPDGPEVALDLLAAEGSGPGGRRLVQPPAYGEAWRPRAEVLADLDAAGGQDPAAWPWTAQVNGDLRLRVLAGVGLQAGIDLQEQIVDAARRQWGAGALAHELLSALRLGVAGATSQWARRLPSAEGDRLAVLGPAAHRVPVGDADRATALAGALERPADGDAPFPTALLGPRVARSVGRARVREAGGTGALVQQAADGLPVVPRPSEAIAAGAGAHTVDAGHLDGLGGRTELVTGGGVTADDVERALVSALHEAEIPELLEDPEDPPRRRPVPGRIVDVLVDAVAPGVSAGPRVVDRISGVDDLERAPLDTADLDLPVWPYLRDVARHWLLPGADTLGAGEVVALRTCPEFVEAFLLGLNQRALAELAWRQHPVRPACTPLRRFWDHVPASGSADDRGGDDVVDVLGWPPTSRIGTHAPSGVRADKLVVVVRSELFRRYPRTLLFLAPSTEAVPTWARGTADLAAAVMPQFVSGMGHDLTMFAFDVAPEAVRRHWVCVQEVPEGVRFVRGGSGGDGGAWAAANLDRPMRVLIPGEDAVGEHEGPP